MTLTMPQFLFLSLLCPFLFGQPALHLIYTFPYTTLFRSLVYRTPGSGPAPREEAPEVALLPGDRKSTRLNSSHLGISYAVFCLKKKKIQPIILIAQASTNMGEAYHRARVLRW